MENKPIETLGPKLKFKYANIKFPIIGSWKNGKYNLHFSSNYTIAFNFLWIKKSRIKKLLQNENPYQTW